jgi:hypothetical protein
MQQHLAYQIVTPRTLAQFHGAALVLSDVRALDDGERQALRRFIEGGGNLIVAGEDATGTKQNEQVARFAESPGKSYAQALEKDFSGTNPSQQSAFLNALPVQGEVKVQASPAVATHIARVDGKVHVFLVNFKGLRGGDNARQETESGVQITVKGHGVGHFLPFLGKMQEIQGTVVGANTVFNLPPIFRGAAFWF